MSASNVAKGCPSKWEYGLLEFQIQVLNEDSGTLRSSIGTSLQLGPHVLYMTHARLELTCAMHSVCETERLSRACPMHSTCPAKFAGMCYAYHMPGQNSVSQQRRCEFTDIVGMCYALRFCYCPIYLIKWIRVPVPDTWYLISGWYLVPSTWTVVQQIWTLVHAIKTLVRVYKTVF